MVLYCRVWYTSAVLGMVLYGMVLYGVVPYGMVWYGTVQHGMTWYCTTQNRMCNVWYYTVCTILHGMLFCVPESYNQFVVPSHS
jgi:hypothetical protein